MDATDRVTGLCRHLLNAQRDGTAIVPSALQRYEEQLTELKRVAPPPVWRSLQETSSGMTRQLRDLRESVMRVRMVQLGEIFERMTFVVRDLARESGKKIIVQLSGGETEIDKFLVERMMGPLLHLVRNAVSHGLETVAEREAKGKRSEGTLSLSAMTAGERIVIKIADDGRGIDRNLVLERATAATKQIARAAAAWAWTLSKKPSKSSGAAFHW